MGVYNYIYIQKTNTGETSHTAGREYTHVRLATKVLGESKNDFFQKSKNQFLGFGQRNIDSKFQDFRVKSVALGAFTSSKPFILDHFWSEKVFGASNCRIDVS